jgi:hypothetical protein
MEESRLKPELLRSITAPPPLPDPYQIVTLFFTFFPVLRKILITGPPERQTRKDGNSKS